MIKNNTKFNSFTFEPMGLPVGAISPLELCKTTVEMLAINKNEIASFRGEKR
jgi:hypothetical protein